MLSVNIFPVNEVHPSIFLPSKNYAIQYSTPAQLILDTCKGLVQNKCFYELAYTLYTLSTTCSLYSVLLNIMHGS